MLHEALQLWWIKDQRDLLPNHVIFTVCWRANRTEGEKCNPGPDHSKKQPRISVYYFHSERKEKVFKDPHFHREMFAEWFIQTLACREKNICLTSSCSSCEDGLFKEHTFHYWIDWMLPYVGCMSVCICFVFFCIVIYWVHEADAEPASYRVSLNAFLCSSAHSSTRLRLVASGASHWDNMLHN